MRLVGIVLGCVLSAASVAREHRNLGPSGLALQGYDPVEYVDYGLALKGFHDITYRHDGALYRFRSRDNREAFAADPQRYMPAYGGWCAYHMGMDGDTGYPRGKYPVDPESFKIIDGRLYLFYNFEELDARALWQRDQKRYRRRADRQWARLNGS